MAESFKNQVDALTGFAGTEDDALTDWLQAGAREIINILPPNLKQYCYSKQTFTSAAANSEAETMITGQLGSVYAGSVECRQIRPMDKHKASTSTSIEFATATDPVYYVEGNKLNILPASSSGIYYVIANPTVAHGSTSIDNFPNEAEYLVTLYASVKALQRLMNNLNSNSDIDTAFTAVNDELDETQAVCDLINGEVDKAFEEVALAKSAAFEIATQTNNAGDFETALDAINTAVDKFRADGGDPALFGDDSTYNTSDSEMTRVKDALDKARNLIDGATMSGDTEPESVQYWLNDEDTEMVQATLATAQSEIQRAQAHIAEWSATGQALQAEINGFATEVQSRAAFTGAKSRAVQAYISTASAYIQTAQGYASEIQAKINISQGYIAEANTRMQRDNQKYQWYQGQQAKLQQDYDKGVQMLISQGLPQGREA